MNARIKSIFSQRRTLYTISAAVFAMAILIVGITLAYFSSSDKVTNEVNTKEYDIKIYEPMWSTTGSNAAKTSEPGETIDKDPYVYNNCENDVYIRVKIEILDSSGNELSATVANAIAEAIYVSYTDSTTNTPLFKDDNGITSNNSYFYYDSTSATTASNYKYDGWFYYVGDNTDALEALESKKSTEKLFNYIHIPELKSEYEDIFDQEFNIVITAQALPTNLLDTSSTSLSSNLSDISAAFNSYITLYKYANT